MRKKNFMAIVISIGIFLILISCKTSQIPDNQTQALQGQVNALETQNAILSANLNAAQQNQASDPGEKIPAAPKEEPDLLVLETSLPAQDKLPIEPVPAGQPISYDGWTIIVDPNIETRGNALWFVIHIRNLRDTNRIIRFQDRSVLFYDNLGNHYSPRPDCFKYQDFVKNLTVEKEGTAKISTGGYCYMQTVNRIPEIIGPIAMDAKQLIMRLEKFGPFDNVEVFFDL